MEEGLRGKDLMTALKAGYAHFWCHTYEPERTIDLIEGFLEEYSKSEDARPWRVSFKWGVGTESEDPMQPLEALKGEAPYSIGILKNYHWFLEKESRDYPVLTQALLDNAKRWRSKEDRKAVVVVSPVPMGQGLPKELHKDFVPVEFGLPDEKEIEGLVDRAIDKAESIGVEINGEKRRRLVVAAKGMTRQEIENALWFCLVKERDLDPRVLNRMKAATLEETAGLKYIEPNVTFGGVIGYERLKEFAVKMVRSPLSLGMLFVGPPGCGKTMFMSALGNESGLPVYEIEFGTIFGSLVGESEAKMSRLIDTIKAIGECLILLDEFEKGIAGVGGSGNTDSGVTKKTIAQWLKFMNSDNRPRGVRIYGTCNDIRAIPPEYLRAERWDCAPFYIGLPNDEAKSEMVEHYKLTYSILGDEELSAAEMKGWSGAEIKSCCRIASAMGTSLRAAKAFIKPIGKIARESLEFLERAVKEDRFNLAEEVLGDELFEDREVEI